MQAVAIDRADKPAHLKSADELDAVMRARRDARRQLQAEQDARRLASRRAAKEAHSTHLIAMPRMAALMKAGALLGSAKALAEALGIGERSLRAKTGAERGVSDDDLRSAADALDARATQLTEHALKLREEASGSATATVPNAQPIQ
jgi:hypothetical protein